MTRLLAALERWHRRRTNRWNTRHKAPAITTRKAKP